mmetsp:Transcript_75322/g.140451  ORF Transcript_75322/g.140451 Transcript_75322/m.140451 type:complete len:218 (+) Transcript_75322:52-705(+)
MVQRHWVDSQATASSDVAQWLSCKVAAPSGPQPRLDIQKVQSFFTGPLTEVEPKRAPFLSHGHTHMSFVVAGSPSASASSTSIGRACPSRLLTKAPLVPVVPHHESALSDFLYERNRAPAASLDSVQSYSSFSPSGRLRHQQAVQRIAMLFVGVTVGLCAGAAVILAATRRSGDSERPAPSHGDSGEASGPPVVPDSDHEGAAEGEEGADDAECKQS